MHTLKKISIPTGTIKRIAFKKYRSALSSISIPTGTIKRLLASIRCCQIIVFQFLLVRLKAVLKHQLRFYFRFQFLLVRLKVFTSPTQSKFLKISIPTGTIKSQFSMSNSPPYRHFNSYWYD